MIATVSAPARAHRQIGGQRIVRGEADEERGEAAQTDGAMSR